MKYVAPAIDVETGELLLPALPAPRFDAVLRERLAAGWLRARPLARAAAAGGQLRSVIERAQSPDLGDPRSVGWTYLVSADDPDKEAISRAIAPLARHRGMPEPQAPLVFSGDAPEDWQDWIEDNYNALNVGTPPHYVLIVGDPERIPFHFQAVLGSAAAVGRLALDDIGSLETYVEKVLRIEADPEGSVGQQALLFATDRGAPDPTYYSRKFMAEPIQHHLTGMGIPVRGLYGVDATRENLLEALMGERCALVYTATHGATRRADPAVQREINGAIVCTSEPGATEQALFAARDVPDDAVPVAEGAVIFAFACFSAGTPAQSDFAHWLGLDLPVGPVDFVAALPNRLLAHPRGPVAFIGHVDLAWLDAFDDPNDPDIAALWHPRLAPFLKAVESVVAPQALGLGMAPMNKRFDIGNATLAIAFDRQQRGRPSNGARDNQRLARAFIARSDAQNYLVLGDPAVYPRMAKTTGRTREIRSSR